MRRDKLRPALVAVAGLVLAACTEASPPPAAMPPSTVTTLAATTSTAPAVTTTVTPTTAPAPAPRSTTTAPATTTPAGPPAVVVSRGSADRRVVALTFDAGADAGSTAGILDTLDRSGIRASFGLTGKWAVANPDLVRRIAGAGHVIINHTFEHRSYTGVSARPALVSADERRGDMERADQAIQALTGHTTRPWFRPPYGDYDASVNALAGALGYRFNVLWTVDSLGWQGLSAAAITGRCLDRAVPGAILLFHVGSASQDAAALPGVIAGLRDRGYGFVTVAELVGG